jgi:hypothetical protein
VNYTHGRYILGSSDFDWNGFEAECEGRRFDVTHLQPADRTADICHDCDPTEAGDNLAQ